MKRFFASLVLLFCCNSPLFSAPEIQIQDAWLRAVPPSSTATAAYLTLINPTASPIQLTGASCEVAESIRPMVTTTSTVNGQEVHGMDFVDTLIIPAQGKLELRPGGDHLMLLNLKRVPKAGETLSLTLTFSSGTSTINIPVRKK